jgi:hypothetical protein
VFLLHTSTFAESETPVECELSSFCQSEFVVENAFVRGEHISRGSMFGSENETRSHELHDETWRAGVRQRDDTISSPVHNNNFQTHSTDGWIRAGMSRKQPTDLTIAANYADIQFYA